MTYTTNAALQRGMVLPITLVLLVIITVVAMAGLDGSKSKERLALRLLDREIAFQAAEAALRAGEAWVEEQRVPPRGSGHMSGAVAARWDGREPSATGFVESFSAVGEIRLASEPLYHIAAGSDPDTFFITARGEGTESGVVVVLRSTYRPAGGRTGIAPGYGRTSWQQLQ